MDICSSFHFMNVDLSLENIKKLPIFLHKIKTRTYIKVPSKWVFFYMWFKICD